MEEKYKKSVTRPVLRNREEIAFTPIKSSTLAITFWLDVVHPVDKKILYGLQLLL